MQPQTQLSEARLLELLLHVADNLDDGVIAFDVRCRYILWNRAMERLTGLLPGEVVGRNIFEVFPALRQGGQEKLLHQALAGQTITSADVPFRVPLDKTGRFEATYFPFKEWGTVAGCVAIVRDLKLQQSVQAAESQRNLSEQRLRSLYEHAPSAVQVFAGDGRLLAVNPAFERLFGITRGQLADYNILEDQQLVTAGIMRQVESVFRGEACEWPELMSAIDRGPLQGQTRWTRSSMYPVVEGGVVREVVWCREDITAQKQAQIALAESEARLRRAHQTAKIGAYELDLRSRQLRWFVELPVLAGLGGGGSLDTWLYHVTADDRVKLRQALEALLAGRGKHLEVCLDRLDGARVWLRCGGEVIRDAGEATHVVGVALDITATRAAELTLRESEERLRFMVSALPQIAWMAGAHGEPEFYNERWFSFVGLREDTREPWNWNDFENPQDHNFHAAAWQQALSLGERFEVEVRLRRGADQSYRWHLLRALPMRDDAGRVTRWFGTATDVHELKMANEELRLGRERLRLAQEAAGAGLWELSLESRELTYSTEFAGMLGLAIGGTATFDDLISRMSSTAEQQLAAKALQKVFRSRKDLRVEFHVRHNGGETRRMLLRGEVVQWLGKPMMIGIAMDVTAAVAEQTVPALVPARAKKSANKSEEKKPRGLRAAAG